MPNTITLEEAQARLADLIEQLAPGEEIIITRAEQPIAKIIGSRAVRKARQPGSGQGMLIIVREDADHLEDFKEYMP